MKSFKSLFILSLLSVTSFAQSLQDFSTVVDPNTFFYGSWEVGGGSSVNPNSSFVQGAGIYDITGASATNSDLSKIEFFFAAPVSIGANGFLEVKAQALGLNAATSFQVVLVDTGATTATATFNASSFLTGSYSTAYSTITFGGGFLSNSVESMIITGGIPSGSARFNFSFDEVAAVASPIPEPSTYAAMAGFLALGLAVWRRRSVVRA